MGPRRTYECRRVGLLLLGAVLLAVPAPAAARTATISGTLELSQAFEQPTAVAGLSYGFDAAPLLSGPAASDRVGLDRPIRASASHYVPITLDAISADAVSIPKPSDCSGFSQIPDRQSIEVADPRALLQIDEISLDVQRGRGEIHVSLANVGAGSLTSGDYVAPGLLRVTTDGCHTDTGEPVLREDGSAYRDVRTVKAVSQYADSLLLRYAPESLEADTVALRRRSGAWRAAVTIKRSDPTTRARLTFALRGKPAALGASCRLPGALSGPRFAVRSRKRAVRLLRRAGFTRTRYAGVRRHVVRRLRNRYGVLRYSSTVLPCGMRVRFERGAA